LYYSTIRTCTDIVNEATENELVASKDITKRLVYDLLNYPQLKKKSLYYCKLKKHKLLVDLQRSKFFEERKNCKFK